MNDLKGLVVGALLLFVVVGLIPGGDDPSKRFLNLVRDLLTAIAVGLIVYNSWTVKNIQGPIAKSCKSAYCGYLAHAAIFAVAVQLFSRLSIIDSPLRTSLQFFHKSALTH